MGYIKEPKGVDFIIQSEPLTKEARQEISEFIHNYKSNLASNSHKKIASTLKKKETIAKQ